MPFVTAEVTCRLVQVVPPSVEEYTIIGTGALPFWCAALLRKSFAQM